MIKQVFVGRQLNINVKICMAGTIYRLAAHVVSGGYGQRLPTSEMI